jgi:hypothetical protein
MLCLLAAPASGLHLYLQLSLSASVYSVLFIVTSERQRATVALFGGGQTRFPFKVGLQQLLGRPLFS